MSILMNLYYTGTDGGARAFVQEMEDSGTANLIRAEAGNERYAYFFPADDQETVLLIDIWEDQAALDRHHASPMMEMVAKLREKYGLRMRAERYVTDREGIPEADAKFIRE